MGYSVSAKFKNQAEQDKMKSFLDSHTEIIEKLSKLRTEGSAYSIDFELVTQNEISYAPRAKNILGFHGRIIPEYIWDLVTWMAVKSSVRDSKGDPFLYYDSAKMKITFDPTNTKNTLVDKYGLPIKIDYENSMSNIYKKVMGVGFQYKEQREIMLELNDLWNDFNLKNSISTKKLKP